MIPDYAGQTNADKNCPRIYEFQAWGFSSEIVAPSAEGVSATIYKNPDDASKVTMNGSYSYVNATLSGTEGESKFQWYQSEDGETFTPIDGATGLTHTMDKADALALAAVRFEVTPVDKNGVEGDPAGTSVVLNSSTNVLAGKAVEADRQFNASEAGSKLTDGDLFTKWCADGVSLEDPRVAVIDMNGIYDLSKLTLRHATAAYDEKLPGADERDRFKEYNTRKYNLYVSNDKKTWTQITACENPDGVGVTEHTYNSGEAAGRYLKVEVTQGVVNNADGSPYDGNSCVRLYEVIGQGTLLDFADKAPSGHEGQEDITDIVPENVKAVNQTADRAPMVGDILAASFDVEEQYQEYARFRWLVADSEDGPFSPIKNSYSSTLPVAEDLAGKWVRVSVRIDQGLTIYSSPIEISENTQPTEQKLAVTFPSRDVEISAADIDLGFANLTGVLNTVLLSGSPIELTFTPAVEGREFAAISVNGENVPFDEDTDTSSYTYEGTMDRADTALNFSFTVVNKLTLRKAIEIASGLSGGDEYNDAVEAVQNKFDKALKAAQDVEADKAADQKTIDSAWSDLLNAIQMLSFKEGDVSALQTLVELLAGLEEDDYTTGSWANFAEKYANAVEVVNDANPLEDDVAKAAKELNAALEALERVASKTELNAAIANATAIEANLGQYIEKGQAEFLKALEKAEALADDRDASQKDVDDATTALIHATAQLRKIPNKDYLKERLYEANRIDRSKYTSASLSILDAAASLAKGAIKNNNLSQEEVDAIADTLDNAMSGLKTVSHNSSGSSHKGSGSSGSSGKVSGEGTAMAVTSPIVTAAQGVAAQQAYVRSDTTLPFTLKHGQAYCFKMTVVGGDTAPSFTVGNGSVLKTQFVAQIGNDYYYRVYAVGAPGQSTGVYTTLPGQNAQRQCAVTIG